MSININYKPKSNESLWETLKNGSFALIQGDTNHPIQEGLYRVFIIDNPERTWILIPMYDGDFDMGIFPYMINKDFPPIKHLISKINIEAEL